MINPFLLVNREVMKAVREASMKEQGKYNRKECQIGREIKIKNIMS